MVVTDAKRYDEFVTWLTDPARFSAPSFRLTDESHSEELGKIATQLKIEGNTEEML